jgi:hypothetical protein
MLRLVGIVPLRYEVGSRGVEEDRNRCKREIASIFKTREITFQMVASTTSYYWKSST